MLDVLPLLAARHLLSTSQRRTVRLPARLHAITVTMPPKKQAEQSKLPEPTAGFAAAAKAVQAYNESRPHARAT